jgi:serine protease Do
MSTRKTTLFYMLLIAVSSFAVALVIASRLDMASQSSAQTFTAPAMNSAPLTGALDAQTFRNVAKAQSPMVVNIRTETTRRAQDLSDFYGGTPPPDDLFRRFFGQPPGDQDQDQDQGQQRQGQGQGQGQAPRRRQPRDQTTIAAGTGFIISKDGLILTNNHVVEGATKIEVSLYGEDADQLYQAKLIGRDELTDSALIQLTEKPNHALPEAKFGDSSQMAAGDWVIAIGNPFGLRHTVSVGVISATERPFPVTDGRSNEMLQTDAAINPGNSGGPLLNIRGEVIGMNTAIIANGRAEGNIGIGFAVPINAVRDLLPQLHTGKVTRGRIGVQIAPVPRDAFQDFGLKSRAGAVVSSVAPGGAADKGGIQPGDVIIEFNGRPVPNSNNLVNMVTATKPGTSVPVKVVREGKDRTLNVTVDELDLQAERGRQGRSSEPAEPTEQGSESFGLTLGNLTPQRSRQLQLPSGQTGALVTEVDPNGPSAGALRPGDIITAVNRQPVTNATEAGRALRQVQAGRIAQILVWRDGMQVFVTVRKE